MTTQRDLDPHTILIVNDNADSLEMMRFLFDKTGYRALAASGAREGLETARRERPHLIISDVVMPESDGIELCRAVRSDATLRATPILLVSALRTDSASAVEGLEAGADDYLEAPFDPSLLIAKAERLIERDRFEAALRESDERYRLLVEGVTEYAIFMMDPAGIISSWNAGAERAFGHKDTEILGRHFSRIFTREDIEQGIPEHELRVAEAEGRATDDRWHARRDGTRFWATGVVTPLRDNGGALRGFSKLLRDNTERKRAEEQLRESEERYRDLVEHSQALLCTHDLEGRLLSMNEWATRVLGYEQRELLGKNLRDILAPEVREQFDDYLAGIQRDGFAKGLMLAQTAAGERSIWEYHNTLRTEGVDEPIVRGMAHDITERKRVEESLRQAEEQLRQAQKLESVGRLAGGIAHDFNNLLTAILGQSELILRRLEEESLRQRVEEIKKAGERAASLTRQLLAFSRKQMLKPKVLDLNDVVTDTDKLLRRLIGENIELVMMRDPALGRVKADPDQLAQVIVNLAVNARDAMPDGGQLTIETKNVYLDEAYAGKHVSVKPGSYVMLAVSDTGAGMDTETQKQIFEPFFTTKEAGKGTGLGLSTVYGIVKQSGGNIWVYSEPGQGTTFKIYLPRVEEEAETGHESATLPELPRGTETVLVVEDEDSVRELVGNILEGEGYTVLAARHGKEALEICERHEGTIHLLITDVVMPEMSGRKLAESLSHKCAKVKVLYMSGYTDNAIVHHGVLDKGANFIQKPFTPAALARKARAALDATSGA